MKNEILKLAKSLCINVDVKTERQDFDVIDYIIYFNGKQSVFTFFTGKTRSGIAYPFDKELLINRIQNFLIN